LLVPEALQACYHLKIPPESLYAKAAEASNDHHEVVQVRLQHY
jgi:hypothetical protein